MSSVMFYSRGNDKKTGGMKNGKEALFFSKNFSPEVLPSCFDLVPSCFLLGSSDYYVLTIEFPILHQKSGGKLNYDC